MDLMTGKEIVLKWKQLHYSYRRNVNSQVSGTVNVAHCEKWCRYYPAQMVGSFQIARHLGKCFRALVKWAYQNCRSHLTVLSHRQQLLRYISMYERAILSPVSLACWNCCACQTNKGLPWKAQISLAPGWLLPRPISTLTMFVHSSSTLKAASTHSRPTVKWKMGTYLEQWKAVMVQWWIMV